MQSLLKASVALGAALLIDCTAGSAQQLDVPLAQCQRYTKLRSVPPHVIKYLGDIHDTRLDITDNPNKVDVGCISSAKAKSSRLLHHYYKYDYLGLHILHYTHYAGFGSHSHMAVVQETKQGLGLVKSIRFLEDLTTDEQIEQYLNTDDPSRYAESSDPAFSDY